MKKYLAIMFAMLMLTSTAYAKGVTSPVFENFDTFQSIPDGTAGSVSFCDSYIQMFVNKGKITADTAEDDKYGTSVKLTSVTDSSGAALNPLFALEKNAVFGFSIYLTGEDSALRLAGKYQKASGTGWMMPMEMKNGKIYALDKELGTYEKNVWYDIRFALRFETHECDVYVNGEKINTSPLGFSGEALKMAYFNINAARAVSDGESAEYLDNMTAYDSNCGNFKMTSSIDSELFAVNPKTTNEITLNFSRELLPGEDINSYMRLENNGADVADAEITPIIRGGYVSGAKISVPQGLKENEDYKIVFEGASDLNGESLKDEISFKTIDNRPVLGILADTEFEKLPENVKVNFKLTKKNFEDCEEIDIYLNGEKVKTIDASEDSFDVMIGGGSNEIYAYAKCGGEDVMSDTLVIEGIKYSTNEEQLINNFDGSNPLTSFMNSSAGAGELKVEFTDNEHGKSLKFLGKQTVGDNKNAYVNTQKINGKAGIVMFDSEFRFDELAPVNSALPILKAITSANKEIFYGPVQIKSSGQMVLQYGSGQEKVLIDKIENDGRWYHFRMYFDCVNKEITVIVDDELKAYRVPMSNGDITDISYLHITAGGFESDMETLIYMDNMKIIRVSSDFAAELTTDTEQQAYEPGSKAVIEFSEPMNTSFLTAENILVKASDGSLCAYTPQLSEDGKTYTMVFDEGLQPDTAYTVEIGSRVKSANGGKYAADKELSFTTQKYPFGINGYRLKQNGKYLEKLSDAAAGEDIILETVIRNRNKETKNAVIAAGWYTALNSLSGFNAVSVTSSADKEVFSMTMTLPEGIPADGCELRIFLTDGFDSLNMYDTLKGIR